MKRFLFGVPLAALVSCGDVSTPAWPVRSDSAGVAHIAWGPGDSPLDWSFEPVLEIGGAADGPGAFGRVDRSGVGVDGGGRIHVLDLLNFRVVTFDRSGNPVRSVGRAGSGPGELRFPSDLAVRADGEVAVFDFDRRAFVRFDPAGSPLEEVPAPGPLMRRVAFTNAGIAGAYRSRTGDSAEIRLVVIGSGDTAAATLASVPEPPARAVDFGCAVVGFRPLLGPGPVWSAAGGRIAVSAGTGYDIDVFDGLRRIARWTRAMDPLPGSAEIAAAELGGDSLRLPGLTACRVPVIEAAERIGFADVAPRIVELAVSPDGALWVAWRMADGRRAIDVWSPRGDWLGTLPSGSPMPVAFRGPDEIVTVERDSFGVPTVRVWRIDGRAGEPTRLP